MEVLEMKNEKGTWMFVPKSVRNIKITKPVMDLAISFGLLLIGVLAREEKVLWVSFVYFLVRRR